MTCRQLISFLSDYTDSELPADQRAAFDEHIRGCPECRTYVEQFRQTVQLTKQLGKSKEPVNLPAHLVKAIVEAVEKTQ